MKAKVAILFAPGTNFDEETKYAFEKTGARADILPMTQLLAKPTILQEYNLIDFPGGFSYGDDLLAGKIWANQVRIYLLEEINKFIKRGGLIIGVCNGFQVLMRSGLLPGFGQLHETAGLIYNKKGKFECRWIRLKARNSRCVFLKNTSVNNGELPVQHGEGRFVVAKSSIMQKLIDNKQIVFQYIDKMGKTTATYPDNPNGSMYGIAGICDLSGQIFGMMPHPEHFVEDWQYPNWRRKRNANGNCFGLEIYKAAVDYIR